MQRLKQYNIVYIVFNLNLFLHKNAKYNYKLIKND